MIYEFLGCALDTALYTLERAGEITRLRPKVFQVLQYLLDNRDRVVSKDELIDTIWRDQFISDATLESTVSAARRAVGDSGRSQNVIQTLPGHGYRLIAPVVERSELPDPETTPAVPEFPDAEPPSAEIEITAPPVTELVTPEPDPPSATPPQPVVSEPPPAPRPPTTVESPSAERRQLTVLFCDIVGSTALVNQLDLEDYREVVRAYQTLCANVIEHFGGYIAQYLGDGLLVYFGYPSAYEDAAQRAVWAGLDILSELEHTLNPRLLREYRIDIAVRLGVHTGPVIIGDIGSGGQTEQLALGETPAIASRLQDLAEPNTLVISDATTRLVQGYFILEDLGTHPLRGISETMPLSRVLERTDAQSRFDVAEAHGIAPLVGREHELGLLMQRWEQAQDGQGQVVVLSGEAGIGKSRLTLAVKEQVVTGAHYRVEWQTSPHHQHTPLYPITDFARRQLQIEPHDTPAEKLEKVEQVMERFRLPLDQSVPLVADLLDFTLPPDRYVPLMLSPQAQRRRTLDTLVTIFQKLSERHPLLFIIEDLQWADPSTLELLNLLLDQIPTSAILAILTCRLEFQWSWQARSYLTQMTLTRLPRVQMAEMAASMLRGHALPDEVLEFIVGKTDGVPLFVEEMTKTIVESGYLTEESTDAAGHQEQLSAIIPDTLQDSLMARLDRLDSAKVVAQYGSVIGRQFPYQLIEVLLPLEAEVVPRELARLVEAELIHQRGRLPNAMFTFKHALVQETAYQSLLRSTRRQLHAQIANLLENDGDDLAAPEPELLAHHYTAANLTEKAVSYWRLAGRVAIARSAHVEAISHLNQGLTLLETLPEGPERAAQELSLQTSLGATLIASKGFASSEVEAVYLRARDLCQASGDDSRLLQVLFGLQAMYLTRGALQRARELGEQCLELAHQQPDPPRLPHAYFALGSTLFFLGDFSLARQYLEQGTVHYDPQIHRTRGLNDPGVSCLLLTAWSLWPLGYPDQALALIQDAFALAEQLRSPFSMDCALACAPVIHQGRGETQAAQARAEAGRKLSEEQDFPHWLALSTTLEGWAMAAQGRKPEGCELIQKGLQGWRDTGAEQTVPYQLALLAETYGKMERPEEGLQTVAEAMAIAERNEEHHYLAELYRIQGELHLSQSEPDETAAETNFNQALSIARSQQAKSLELRAAMSMGRLWQQQSKEREAHRLLSDIYEWFSEGFDTEDLQAAKALLDMLAAS